MAKPINGTPAFGMSRVQAAHHIGIGVALFDGLVAQGKVPPPRKIGTRLIWIRYEVEDAIESPHVNAWHPPGDNALAAAIAQRNRQKAKA